MWALVKVFIEFVTFASVLYFVFSPGEACGILAPLLRDHKVALVSRRPRIRCASRGPPPQGSRSQVLSSGFPQVLWVPQSPGLRVVLVIGRISHTPGPQGSLQKAWTSGGHHTHQENLGFRMSLPTVPTRASLL